MHTKTIEGLLGASTNMKLLNTPLRVYKEAEQRGDTDTMARAMGYVEECSDKAEEYMEKTQKGMEEDAILKRQEERQQLEAKIAETKSRNTDTIDISKDGKAALQESKYSALWEYVSKSESDSFKMTFEDIHNIAGVPIDHSFLKYKKELLEYGYQVGKISMKEKTVIFNKS